MHVILATQRPRSGVITGMIIKRNSRTRVASRSRAEGRPRKISTVQGGAYARRGDLLIQVNGTERDARARCSAR